MGVRKYLFYFSYCGTYFNGLQRQVSRDLKYNEDPTTVQGLIEFGLSRMKPKNAPVLVLSSRTDQGVHAVKTSACVDLDFSSNIEPRYIQYSLNKFFDDTELDIRIIDVLPVKSDFDARRLAVWRKYAYKLAILKPGVLPGDRMHRYFIPVPATEQKRCYYVPNETFDVDRIKQAAELFIGTKDFLTFVAKPSILDPERTTVRSVLSLDVQPANCGVFPEYYDYWNITCQGKSFLYKQVRRMVAVLLAAAQRRLSLPKIETMINEPSPKNWPKGLMAAPSHGLYLMDVYYDPKDIEYDDDKRETSEQQKPDSKFTIEDEQQEEEEEEEEEEQDPAIALEKKKETIRERLLKKRQLKELLRN